MAADVKFIPFYVLDPVLAPRLRISWALLYECSKQPKKINCFYGSTNSYA